MVHVYTATYVGTRVRMYVIQNLFKILSFGILVFLLIFCYVSTHMLHPYLYVRNYSVLIRDATIYRYIAIS